MEFWGFDRSRTSLRLRALERIAAIAPVADVARLAAIVPVDQALSVPELEVLVALAKGAARPAQAIALETLAPKLTRLLYASLELVVPPRAETGLLAREALFERLEVCPSRVVAQYLTQYVAESSRGRCDTAFTEFFARFSRKMDAAKDLDDDQYLAALGALIGLLEGVPRARVSESAYATLFPLLQPLCATEFLESVQTRLGSILDPAAARQGISVARIAAAVARVCARYAERATERQALLDLVEFSDAQLLALESADAPQTAAIASPEQLPLLKAAVANYFRVLASAVDRYVVPTAKVFPHVLRALRALSEPFDVVLEGEPDSAEPSAFSIVVCWLAAVSVREDDLRLAQVLELLPHFLSELEPATAARAAAVFTKDFARFHRSESSHVKVLYSIANHISPTDYREREADGEYAALRYTAALMSSLVAVVTNLNSPPLVDLVVTILEQKEGEINEKVDLQALETWSLLVPHISAAKFTEGLNAIDQFERAHADDARVLSALESARVGIARVDLSPGSRKLYLKHLLDLVVVKYRSADLPLVSHLLAPLATLAQTSPPIQDWSLLESFRNAWFNLVLMGFVVESLSGDDLRHLKTIAAWAPPLVSEESANHIESDLQLNPMLARGTSDAVLNLQRGAVARAMGSQAAKNKSQVKLLFIAATILLERLRAQAGGIAKMPLYFEDTEFSSGDGFARMQHLAKTLVTEYLSRAGYGPTFMLPAIASELRELLVLSCHRVESVRRVAVEMAHLLITSVPAALCQHNALFALLDCLSLLDEAFKNVEDDEYSPKAKFTAPLSGVTLELNDDVASRRNTFRRLEEFARSWIGLVSTTMAPDLRSKLFTYLASPLTAGFGRRLTLDILSSDTKHGDFALQYLQLSKYNRPSATRSYAEVSACLRAAKTSDDLHSAYSAAAQCMAAGGIEAVQIARESVRAPFRIFSEQAVNAGILIWHHIIRKHDELRSTVVNEVVEQTIISVYQGKGLFTRAHDQPLPLWTEMEYAPSNKKKLDLEETLMMQQLAPHRRLLRGFLRSCMYNSVLLSPIYIHLFTRLNLVILQGLRDKASLHSLSRELRLDLLGYGFELLSILNSLRPAVKMVQTHVRRTQRFLLQAALAWYIQPAPQNPFGSSLQNQKITLKLLRHLGGYISSLLPKTKESQLLALFVANEYHRLSVWLEPLATPQQISHQVAASASHTITPRAFGIDDVQTAWEISPHLAVYMMRWFHGGDAPENLLRQLMDNHLMAVYDCADALYYYLDGRGNRPVSHKVLYWAQLSPIDSINLLAPKYSRDKYVSQFALRSLQSHPIQICFFYVPQIVQQLRHDTSGYVEEYILEDAKFSQKFAHQIIWNMLANMYIDDDATVPNDMKPQLDKVLATMKSDFTDDERSYYETEFGFFDSVTAISGKLKPYIKKSKAEKKEKIDQEMAVIKVPNDVYLPSHPDGTVIDIDRTGGKPLQSHAKAPFLARFKIRVEEDDINENDVTDVRHRTVDVWQGAIFKVGDDCRQDVLALQIISVFRSIFNYSGLDVYVFPYKVTATAAGRGVIDVLPNSTSRDMLGREAVNGLNQWFHSKHGGPDSIDFQRARLNFIKSMAAYSVISWLIQFKDRHNGNIMYDDDGHCIHIDFGFCFDIVPGGVKFEAAPFKLTKEMVQVMGGSQQAQPYRWFEEQCVRTFLASRVFADEICRMVIPMLESGLPCFKGHTIQRLRSRFALNRSEADAAAYMRSLISKSYESNFTKGYDEFQRITNGIPY